MEETEIELESEHDESASEKSENDEELKDEKVSKNEIIIEDPNPKKETKPKIEPEIEFPESNLIIPTLKGRSGRVSHNNSTDGTTPSRRSLPAWKQAELDKKNQNPKKIQEQVRGKKGKNKKIKNKYKDQDEEERAEIIKLLNADGKYSTNENSKKNRRKNKKKAGSSSQPSASKIVKNAIQSESKTAENNEVKPAFKNVDQLRDMKKDNGKEHDDRKVPDNSENNNNNLEETDLNELIYTPNTEDTILFAIPICAPYTTMINYKYKVKLQPGTTKKGKAARTAVNLFLNNKETTQIEKDLIKAVNESELFKNLPGKVKLVNTGNLHGKKRWLCFFK